MTATETQRRRLWQVPLQTTTQPGKRLFRIAQAVQEDQQVGVNAAWRGGIDEPQWRAIACLDRRRRLLDAVLFHRRHVHHPCTARLDAKRFHTLQSMLLCPPFLFCYGPSLQV